MRCIEKIIKNGLGYQLTDADLVEELEEICEVEHSSCNDNCPVHEANGGPVNPDKPFKVNRGCDCFKNGQAMLDFLNPSL